MAIYVDRSTRLLVQGITGHQARFNTGEMLKAGTRILAGTSPGKGGQMVHNIPVYDTVNEAMEEHPEINTTIIIVPARHVLDAFTEALNAGIKTMVVVSEHVPLHDEMKMARMAQMKDVHLIGPNCPGVFSPGKAKVGIIPNMVAKEGSIGVVSRSGTLTYEIVYSITQSGMGESTCVGIGGDRISGTSFVDVLKDFESDRETEAVVLVGEIGGGSEQRAARYIHENMDKPVVAYIAGRFAPPGKRMGHAGAIVSGGSGTAEAKIKALEAAGVSVAQKPGDIPTLLKEALNSK